MNQINCPVCGTRCVKSGKTKAGAQRWLCRKCKSSLTCVIDNRSKELQLFLDWLFSKNSQSIMPGEGLRRENDCITFSIIDKFVIYVYNNKHYCGGE